MKYMIGFLAGIILLQGAVAHGHPPPDVTAEALALALSSNGNTAVDCSSGTTCTFDVDADGTADFTMSTSGLTIPRVANPCVTFGDVNTSDTDDNAQICVNCTDTGSGTEDCDMTISQQIAGAMTDVWVLDADAMGVSNITSFGNWVRTDMAASLTDNHMQQGITSSRGPKIAPRAGTVRGISCVLYQGSSGTITTGVITTSTGTNPNYLFELYVNETDAADIDCSMDAAVGTCNAVTLSTTFAAGDRIALGVTTPADLGNSTYDAYCDLWVTFE